MSTKANQLIRPVGRYKEIVEKPVEINRIGRANVTKIKTCSELHRFWVSAMHVEKRPENDKKRPNFGKL